MKINNQLSVQNIIMKTKSRIILGILLLLNINILTSQNSQQIIEKLDKMIENAAKEKLFSGSVMLTYNGETIYSKSVGLRNIENNQLNHIDTKFNVGSMNKMHTAVSILQLVQNDKLKLDDKLIDILTDYPNKEGVAKVTIHHLLTHTSGFGDYLSNLMGVAKDKYQEINDYLPLITSDELKFEPGERFSYSNSGFMILGAVIEKISGLSYFDYVQKNIYNKVGMKNTGFDLYINTKLKNLATNYTKMLSRGKNLDVYIHPGKGGPAGGGYSTVEDWLKFGHALESFKLIDEKYVKLLTEGKVTARNKKYAYGFFNENLLGISAIGHGGGGPGINGGFEIYKGAGYSIAILSNIDPPGASIIKDGFRALLLDQKNLVPKPSVTGNIRFELEGYDNKSFVSVVGDFNNNNPFVTIMKREKGKWVCNIDLESGQYSYRFFIDGYMIPDPVNEVTKKRGMRTVLSILKVD